MWGEVCFFTGMERSSFSTAVVTLAVAMLLLVGDEEALLVLQARER